MRESEATELLDNFLKHWEVRNLKEAQCWHECNMRNKERRMHRKFGGMQDLSYFMGDTLNVS